MEPGTVAVDPLRTETRNWCLLGALRSSRGLLTGSVVVLFVGMFLTTVPDVGRDLPFRLVQADTYYYLVVAANTVEHGKVSFDQERPTTGFHPLWQGILIVEYAVARMFPHPRIAGVWAAVLTTLVLMTMGLGLVAWAAYSPCRPASILLLGLPAGVYSILAWRFVGARALLWQQINGMEGALSLVAFGFLVVLLAREVPWNAKRWTGLGIGLLVLILSRLDSVFFAVAFAVPLGMEALRSREAFRGVIRAYGILAAGVLLYLGMNLWYAGRMMPVSGALKSTFPYFNGRSLGDIADVLIRGSSSPETKQDIHRVAQLLIPLAFSGVYLVGAAVESRFRMGRWLSWDVVGGSSAWRRFLWAANGFVVLEHTYDLLFVFIWHQGEWYSVLAQVVMTLTAVDVVSRVVGRAPGWVRGRVTVGVIAVLLVIWQVSLFSSFKRGLSHRHVQYTAAFYHGNEVRGQFAGERPRIVSFDDGILAYSFGFPTLSGMGLMLDSEAVRAFSGGRLLDLAWDRGYRYIASSWYIKARDFPEGSSPEQVTGRLRHLLLRKGQHAEGFAFRIAYRPSDQSFILFSMERTRGPGRR